MISIEEMSVFCKKKGLVYPTAEIYGSLAGFWDYGPLGVELKKNIINLWWKKFVQEREDIVGIDGAIITNPKVWKASGHVDSFTDILVECTKCKTRLRADHLIEDKLGIKTEGAGEKEISEILKDQKIVCPKCHGNLSSPKHFNLMFVTEVGPVEGEKSYLRAETAQLIFANFKLIYETSRKKMPFGIAQKGKAFRNEISPRDFLFRSREFEQMEIEFFVHPEKKDDCLLFKEVEKLKVNILTAEKQGKKNSKEEGESKKIGELVGMASKWHLYWLGAAYQWFLDLGVKEKKLRLREHLKDELAHYAGACFDIEYKFPFGWKEIYGNAERKQFDLQQHAKFSKKEMTVFDEESKEKVIPYVASEPSQGVDRSFLTFLYDAYENDKKRGNIVLKLHPQLSPVKVGVFPLVNKLDGPARQIYEELKKEFVCIFDRSGSVGRRYARADEIGIPFCITYDFESEKDKNVTIRDRDSTKQIRVKIKDLKDVLSKLIKGEKFNK